MKVLAVKKELLKGPALRPMNWRAVDARRIAAGETPIWSTESDADTRVFVEYLRSLDATQNEQQQAIAFACDIADQHHLRRWVIEAALVAGWSDDEISLRCGVAPLVIECYERFFFAVRGVLGDRDYILKQVIGQGLWEGFRIDELDRFWKAVGYLTDKYALEQLFRAFFKAWQPGEPATLAVHFRENPILDLHLKSAVLTRLMWDRMKARAVLELFIRCCEITWGNERADAELREKIKESLLPRRHWGGLNWSCFVEGRTSDEEGGEEEFEDQCEEEEDG